MSHTEETAFSIISLAGDGRAALTKAMKSARKGDFGQAEELFTKLKNIEPEIEHYWLLDLDPKEEFKKRIYYYVLVRVC